MVPSTMYANAILPVPWTVAQRVYVQQPRMKLPSKPLRKPFPKLRQDREAAEAVKRVSRLLTAASTASDTARRLLDDIRAFSRPLDAADMRAAVAELTNDLIAQTREVIAASNELRERIVAASDSIPIPLLHAISRQLDSAADVKLGIRADAEGRLSLDERNLIDRLHSSDEPINSSYLSLAVFAAQIGSVSDRLLGTPEIRELQAQTSKLHACTAYGRKKQLYLLIPLNGLLVNEIG